jgi:transcriptional regulator with XRE-family HTH domain
MKTSPVDEQTKQFANLGLALRLLRELRRLSQTSLARQAGIGKSRLSKYENGKELPKLYSLERLLEILEVRQDAFFGVIATLDGLHEQLVAEPGTELTFFTTVPSARSIPPLDAAFAAAFQSLLLLQRSFLQLLLTGVALPSPKSPRVIDPTG